MLLFCQWCSSCLNFVIWKFDFWRVSCNQFTYGSTFLVWFTANFIIFQSNKKSFKILVDMMMIMHVGIYDIITISFNILLSCCILVCLSKSCSVQTPKKTFKSFSSQVVFPKPFCRKGFNFNVYSCLSKLSLSDSAIYKGYGWTFP